MAGITLAQAEAQLAVWLNADTAVASGQSYSIGSRQLTRANAQEITAKIDYWNGKIQQLSRGGNGGMRVRGITPV
jgi:hypothetical protein